MHASDAWVGVLVVACAAAPVQAQEDAATGSGAGAGQFASVTMSAQPSTPRESASGDFEGGYDVSLMYDVTFAGAPVELSALGLDGVTLQAILVRLDGEPVVGMQWDRVNLTAGTTQVWRGLIPTQAEGMQATLNVRYEVEGAFRPSGELTLPVMAVDLAPPAALPGAFVAEVRLPAVDGVATHVRKAFPTDVTGGTGQDDPIVSASLPTLPRTLRFQLGSGEAAPWARTSLLELLATGLIVGFGLLGWRHLVRSV